MERVFISLLDEGVKTVNVLIFDKASASLVLKSPHLVKLANLVAFMREDGSFEVMKDRTGTCHTGEVVAYSKLMIIMSNMMFNYLLKRG